MHNAARDFFKGLIPAVGHHSFSIKGIFHGIADYGHLPMHTSDRGAESGIPHHTDVGTINMANGLQVPGEGISAKAHIAAVKPRKDRVHQAFCDNPDNKEFLEWSSDVSKFCSSYLRWDKIDAEYMQNGLFVELERLIKVMNQRCQLSEAAGRNRRCPLNHLRGKFANRHREIVRIQDDDVFDWRIEDLLVAL